MEQLKSALQAGQTPKALMECGYQVLPCIGAWVYLKPWKTRSLWAQLTSKWTNPTLHPTHLPWSCRGHSGGATHSRERAPKPQPLVRQPGITAPLTTYANLWLQASSPKNITKAWPGRFHSGGKPPHQSRLGCRPKTERTSLLGKTYDHVLLLIFGPHTLNCQASFVSQQLDKLRPLRGWTVRAEACWPPYRPEGSEGNSRGVQEELCILAEDALSPEGPLTVRRTTKDQRRPLSPAKPVNNSGEISLPFFP